jgi:hypothetical protein
MCDPSCATSIAVVLHTNSISQNSERNACSSIVSLEASKPFSSHEPSTTTTTPVHSKSKSNGEKEKVGGKKKNKTALELSRRPQFPESLTYMLLKKCRYAHATKKNFRHMCHDLNFCLLVCHSVQLQLELNGFTVLTRGTHAWK